MGTPLFHPGRDENVLHSFIAVLFLTPHELDFGVQI